MVRRPVSIGFFQTRSTTLRRTTFSMFHHTHNTLAATLGAVTLGFALFATTGSAHAGALSSPMTAPQGSASLLQLTQNRGAPNICPKVFRPVCGQRGVQRRTYGNACMATSAGARIIARGPCQPVRPRPQFCTREYRPVCARVRGRVTRTFPNACEARRAGGRIIHRGVCRRPRPRPVICPQIFRPVCARVRGRKPRTYGNACFARGAGAKVLYRGRCISR